MSTGTVADHKANTHPVHVAIVLPHLRPGGAERTASELANFLAASGDLVFLVLMYRRERFFMLDPRITVIEPNWDEPRWGKAVNVIHILMYLRRVIRDLHVDVVFSLGYMAFTLAATLRLPCKVIISGRSSPLRVRFPGNRLLNFTYELSHRILAMRVDGIIAQTTRAAERYLKSYQCPVRVVPNFLRKIEPRGNGKQNWVVTVGRCEKEKGHSYLLSAFARLQAPLWSLVIIGDGPERGRLQVLAAELGITDRVQFEGFRKNVDYYLGQAKIFAFPSLHEGFPNALLEAMATPLPCVSFDCVAGPSEIIRDGENGFLVPVGDVDALAERLQQLVDDEPLRDSLQQKAMAARSEYDIALIGARYRNFFVEILISVRK